MAEETKPRIARLKIKFGSTVVATQAVRIPGLVSCASADSKDAKQGPLALARRRQASLQGYVPPSASPDAIVARLREGEGFAPGAQLPPWDFNAPAASKCHERPAKRPRATGAVAEACAVPSCAAGTPGAPSVDSCPPGPGTERGCPAEPLPEVKAQPKQHIKAADIAPPITRGAVESGCGQASKSQACIPLSKEEAAAGAGRAHATAGPRPHSSSAEQSTLASSMQLPPRFGQSSRTTTTTLLAPAASASVAGSAPSSARTPNGPLPHAAPESCSAAPPPRDELPSTSGRPPLPSGPAPAPPPALPPREPSGVSVETQTSQRDFPILPTSFLDLPRLSGTALSYASIGPFDLQLEREQSQGAAEGRIEGWIEEGRRMKKEGDALFHRNNKVWTIRALSKYISSALLFMEAADAMMRDRHRHSSTHITRAAQLYGQTSNLLGYTVTFADTLKGGGSGVGREALRLLAERLSAVCLLRQTALLAGSFKTCADRAQAALKEHSRQQAAAGAAGAGLAAGPSGSGPLPSPEDSSTSTLQASAGGAAAVGAPAAAAPQPGGGGSPASLPGLPQERVAELLEYAKTTARFTDQMKRSCKSFEAFMERADVRQDQQAKLVCMHLAAVCMDVGMAGGMRIIHHAREAVRTLCDDLAR